MILTGHQLQYDSSGIVHADDDSRFPATLCLNLPTRI